MHCTYAFFKNCCQKEVPDDCSCEQKRAALWDRTLKCCVGRHILVLYSKTQQDATE